MATLRTEDLTKSYSGRTVVRGVNLEIASGEVVGLLGANGAGKTTTFSMVVGLTAPDSGRVLLDGHDVTDDPMYIRAPEGHRLPAAGAVDLPRTDGRAEPLAILETLDLDDSAAAPLRELLAELGLTPLAKSPAYTLSGGERRRVEITARWSCRPQFMLLDEPFAGIDPIAVTDIQKIIFHLKVAGDRRPDHRPQRPRNPAHHRPRLHRPRRRDLQERNARKPGGGRGGETDLPRRRLPIGLRLMRRAT